MPRYRKKPIVVEAVRITDEWFDGDHPNPLHPIGVVFDPSRRTVHMPSPGGGVGHVGDWLITDESGDLSVVELGIFEATYEPVFQPNPDLRFKGSPMSPELEAQFKAIPAEMDRYNTAMRTWLDGQSTTPETRKRARELFGMGPEQANKPAPEPELADSDDLVEGDG